MYTLSSWCRHVLPLSLSYIQLNLDGEILEYYWQGEVRDTLAMTKKNSTVTGSGPKKGLVAAPNRAPKTMVLELAYGPSFGFTLPASQLNSF